MLVYSYFVQCGADIMALVLEANGFQREGRNYKPLLSGYVNESNLPKRRYAYLRSSSSKSIAQTDDEIINKINGKNGGKCDEPNSNEVKVLIIASKYGEGIDLTN